MTARMRLTIDPGDDESAIDVVVARTAEVIEAGGTAIIPTDTVYGLAASATVLGATRSLFELKGRSTDQAFAVLVADPAQAMELCLPLGSTVEAMLAAHWPGPLTIVARRSSAAASMDLGGDPGTIGIRCPDSRFVRSLAARIGPLATTSANCHGEPSPVDAGAAAEALLGAVDLVVDGGPSGTVASTVLDITVSPWQVRRQGAIAASALGL